jgi:hypothetical protein
VILDRPGQGIEPIPHESIPRELQRKMYVRMSDIPLNTMGANYIVGIVDRLMSKRLRKSCISLFLTFYVSF